MLDHRNHLKLRVEGLRLLIQLISIQGSDAQESMKTYEQSISLHELDGYPLPRGVESITSGMGSFT